MQPLFLGCFFHFVPLIHLLSCREGKLILGDLVSFKKTIDGFIKSCTHAHLGFDMVYEKKPEHIIQVAGYKCQLLFINALVMHYSVRKFKSKEVLPFAPVIIGGAPLVCHPG